MMTSGSVDTRRSFVLAVGLLSLAILYPVFVTFYMPAGHGLDVTGHPLGRDFINFWAAPRIAFSAHSPALFDVDLYNNLLSALFGAQLPPHWWSYPPVVTMLLWPLTAVPYATALAAWTIIGFGLYVLATLPLVEARYRALTVMLLILAPASLINIVGGQNGFFTAALFVGGISLLERRPVLAGILIGALSFKPQLGLTLPLALVVLCAWRTIAVAAVVAIALYAASALVLGVDAWQKYLGVTVPAQLQWMAAFDGFFTSMLVSVTAGLLQAGAAFDTALRVQAAVSILVAIVAALAVRRTDDPTRRLLVLASAAPLCTPWCFNYDLPMLSAAWVVFVMATGRGAIIGTLTCLVPAIVMRSSSAPLLAQAMLCVGFGYSLHLIRNDTANIRSLTFQRA